MYRFLCTVFFIALCENIQHTLFYTQSLITRWSAGCLNCTSKGSPSLPLVESMFNLEDTPLLNLYIYAGWLKGSDSFGWPLSFRLARLCLGGNFILFWDLNVPRVLSGDILFPEGKMFLTFPICPELLPPAQEPLSGHRSGGVCSSFPEKRCLYDDLL